MPFCWNDAVDLKTLFAFASLQRILEIYGDWLYERREFRQAASGT